LKKLREEIMKNELNFQKTIQESELKVSGMIREKELREQDIAKIRDEISLKEKIISEKLNLAESQKLEAEKKKLELEISHKYNMERLQNDFKKSKNEMNRFYEGQLKDKDEKIFVLTNEKKSVDEENSQLKLGYEELKKHFSQELVLRERSITDNFNETYTIKIQSYEERILEFSQAMRQLEERNKELFQELQREQQHFKSQLTQYEKEVNNLNEKLTLTENNKEMLNNQLIKLSNDLEIKASQLKVELIRERMMRNRK